MPDLTISLLFLGGLGLAMLLLALQRWAEHTQRKSQSKGQGKSVAITEQIHAELPKTQCAQCGYPGCRPYAQAVADGVAHNLCPPGGDALVERLGQLLNRAPLTLAAEKEPPQIAFIREQDCIGCAKCLPACPVDAILGAAQYMHTVIAQDCTGCKLCLDPCPVDCIEMHQIDLNSPTTTS